MQYLLIDRLFHIVPAFTFMKFEFKLPKFWNFSSLNESRLQKNHFRLEEMNIVFRTFSKHSQRRQRSDATRRDVWITPSVKPLLWPRSLETERSAHLLPGIVYLSSQHLCNVVKNVTNSWNGAEDVESQGIHSEASLVELFGYNSKGYKYLYGTRTELRLDEKNLIIH
jgi:hypothetical protein